MIPGRDSTEIKPGQSKDALLQGEVLSLLYDGFPAALLANVLLATLLVFVQWPVINSMAASGWLVLLGVVLAVRFVMYLNYRRLCSASAGLKTDLLQQFRLGLIATGVVWGIHVLLLFPVENIAHQVFLVFVIAGVSSGAITSLSADRTSALGFVIPVTLPLVPMLFMVDGTISLTMSVMVLLFLVYVAASSSRLQHQLHENIRLRNESGMQELNIRRQQQLNKVIAHAQSEFIHKTDRRKAFDGLLLDILELTGSEYGFVGEVLYTQQGVPYLKTYAITNVAWNDATRAFYETNAPQGMEFGNIKTLFGAVLTSGQPVIANDPYHDPRRGGLPEGHPVLNAFLGMPVHHGEELVAMVGISNRPGGYDQALVDYLQPLIITVGQLVAALRIQQQHQVSQKALDQFKSTLDRTLDCVFMFDATSLNFFYVNEGGLRQVGYSCEELLEMRPYDIKPEFSETQFHELIAPLISGEKDMLTFETMHQHKNGQCIPVEVFLQYMAPQDESSRFVAIVRDITERKRIERMKSEFVSTVSHELRTPLTSISGALGLIAGGALGALPEKVGELISIAHKNSLRLTFLINDLLDMEKLAAGKVEFNIQPHSLTYLIKQSLEANRAYGAERQVTMRLIEPVAEVMVQVDGQRIMQVLSNLLSNAIKFSPENGVVDVIVILRSGWVRISVIDDGPGIPAAFREHIFQKFAQADSSDTRQKGGTGLGLAITRELVERMGGEVGFDSVENEGASFFFDLPV